MKHTIYLLVLLSTLTSAQERLEDVCKKALSRLGGAEIVDSLYNVHVTQSIRMKGMTTLQDIYIINDKAIYSKTSIPNFGDQTIVMDKNGAWQISSTSSEALDIPKDQVATLQSQLNIKGILPYCSISTLPPNFSRLELEEKLTEIDNEPHYGIKAFGKDGGTSLIYISKESLLTTEMRVAGNSIKFSDYRKINNGMLFPFKQAIDAAGIDFEINVSKIEANIKIDPDIFKRPTK